VVATEQKENSEVIEVKHNECQVTNQLQKTEGYSLCLAHHCTPDWQMEFQDTYLSLTRNMP
jgi:hypothetical protein